MITYGLNIRFAVPSMGDKIAQIRIFADALDHELRPAGYGYVANPETVTDSVHVRVIDGVGLEEVKLLLTRLLAEHHLEGNATID